MNEADKDALARFIIDKYSSIVGKFSLSFNKRRKPYINQRYSFLTIVCDRGADVDIFIDNGSLIIVRPALPVWEMKSTYTIDLGDPEFFEKLEKYIGLVAREAVVAFFSWSFRNATKNYNFETSFNDNDDGVSFTIRIPKV